MGETLITDIAEATGLPQNLMTDELGRLISAAGIDSGEVTLEDLRSILADYLQEVLLAARDEFSPDGESAVSP